MGFNDDDALCFIYPQPGLILLLLWIQIGAAAVNLVAQEKPADVYSGIAAR